MAKTRVLHHQARQATCQAVTRLTGFLHMSIWHTVEKVLESLDHRVLILAIIMLRTSVPDRSPLLQLFRLFFVVEATSIFIR